MRAMTSSPRVLLTGATGFVGSHIYPDLVARGFDVLCGSRNPTEALRNVDGEKRHYCRIDLADRASIDHALKDVDSAIYLVHSMSAEGAYAKAEVEGATNFRDAAEKRGLRRIVYLGGMRPKGKASRHLASRLHTGEILRSGSVPVVELQATMVVGGGSESFRIVRDLAARLPIMLLPKWLDSQSQPVAIRDVSAAIVHALKMPVRSSQVLTLPGPEKLSGRDIIMRVAHQLNQEPRVIRVPFVTPRLSSYWIRLVTRANPHVAAELVEGLRTDILSQGPTIWSLMPQYRRSTFDEAVRTALAEEQTTLPLSTRMVERVLHRVAREPAEKQV